MSIYDAILAEMKIANGELQVIRVALERIERHVCPFPAPAQDRVNILGTVRAKCRIKGCAAPASIIDHGEFYCANHAARTN